MAPEHITEQTLPSWVHALEQDHDLIAALIAVTWEEAAEAQLKRVSLVLPPGVIVGMLRAGAPATTDEATFAILERVREMLARPPSPDVAEAMGSAS